MILAKSIKAKSNFSFDSLVKLHHFQFAFLENCVYKNKRNQ